ncbi:MAG: 8-amino-7-oxononanoate synthase, partial [Halomonas sp.]|nr:8-amino-7-oxononanoate synthase [Halomonas sp.]
ATPIQPLIFGDEVRTLIWAGQLQKRAIHVGAIRPPTVPKGEARLRITLSARHQRGDIDSLLAALDQCQHQEALCSPCV